MSYLNIENRQGVRYRVREGWYYPPHLPQGLTEHFVDLPLLQSFDEAVLEQICHKFLGFAQALPDPTNPHYRPQFESTFQFDPYAGAPAFFSDPGKKIYLAMAQQRLIIEENPLGEDELAEQQSQLLQKIRMALRRIIAQERAEAAQHAQRLARESRTNRALIYTGAFFNGLWNAGVDLAKWAKEVNDVINPTQRLLRSMHASHRALQRSRENGENILTAYLDEHLKGEKRELVQALGFDPTAITQEQFDQAMEIADLVWESPALRADLIRFAKDYVQAQHAIELTNLSGSAAFEILFTIILAAVTAGAGLAASAASQARHLAKFRKVGDLLMEFAEHIKKVRQRLRRSSMQGNGRPSRSLDELPVDEVIVSKNVEPVVSKPKPIPEKVLEFDYDSPKAVTFAEFKASVKEFSDDDTTARLAYKLFQEEDWEGLEKLFKEKDLNGAWPPNGGAISSQKITLQRGKTVDRYGGWYDEDGNFRDTGAYMADMGENFENRALPDAVQEKPLKKYLVIKDIPDVSAGKAIPWFGKSGKGFQYELPESVEDLVELGYLKEL